jgi:hypothetical protein
MFFSIDTTIWVPAPAGTPEPAPTVVGSPGVVSAGVVSAGVVSAGVVSAGVVSAGAGAGFVVAGSVSTGASAAGVDATVVMAAEPALAELEDPPQELSRAALNADAANKPTIER